VFVGRGGPGYGIRRLKGMDNEEPARNGLPLRWLVIIAITVAAGISVASAGPVSIISTVTTVFLALHVMTGSS
jgi:ABC-type cobalamin transport system permease subunit